MFETYLRLYKHYVTHYGPNTAIFLLVGSFYELYDIRDKSGEGQTSFERATTILGIQKVPKGEGLFSAGFKDSSMHKFATMLTRENWTVVVVDQVKDEKGAVSSRDVARILSPGTHIENTGADSFYTAGLWLQAEWNSASPPRFAAAAVDLTTGALHTYEGEVMGKADWSSDSLLHFFQVHQPKELVVWWRGHSLDQPTETFLRRTLGIPTALIHVRSVLDQGALEKPIVREDLLRRCFKPKSLLPLRSALGIAELPLTERALASLLLFVEDHYSAAIDMLRIPTAWSPEHSVYLGNHALTQLNMLTAREEDSVLGIFMKTYTPMGRRAMRRRLLYPITQAAVLETLYTEIDWCHEKTSKEAILENLRQIGDLSRLHRRLTVGTVNAADVTSLDMSYVLSTRILTDTGDGPLSTFRQSADRLNEYREAFATVFDIEKALKPQEDMFCLTAAAGPKTAAVEAEIAAARATIEAIHRELSAWVGVEKESFRLEEKEASIVVAAGKVVIKETERALKAGAPASLKGIQIHAKKSSSSLEIPAINAQYTKILALRLALAGAVKEELPAACDSLTPYTDLWDELEDWISKVDMSFTIARVSKERGFVRPQLVEATAASLQVTGLRHPLIEAQQTRTEYVKHDVELINKSDAATGWLVYGMNASGKSSLMKAVGIATILAQAGCFVPATTFSYTPFRSLFTRILNTDNLWAGLSSFAVEMTELAEILRRADPWSLVLGDEVCSGTESMSAMSLVGASLEHLSKRGARFIFATHLHGLQEIPAVSALPLKVWHLQVRFDPKTQRLTYDRTLHPGAGSSLYGLEVAKAMAIPFEVLESAHAIRKALVGTAVEQDAPLSGWNSGVQRRACAVCGSERVRDLEAHHIEARATATAGRLADGSDMNHMRNLTVLCEVCHDKVHAGTLEVGPTRQTSEGPVLDVKDLSAFAFKPKPKGDLTEEQLELIKNDLRNYRTLTPARLIFYIDQHHGIKLTLARLKTIRASL